MIIVETCPMCGHDLRDNIIYTHPPIPVKECYQCGWKFEGKPEKIVRVPFGGNSGDYLAKTNLCEVNENGALD